MKDQQSFEWIHSKKSLEELKINYKLYVRYISLYNFLTKITWSDILPISYWYEIPHYFSEEMHIHAHIFFLSLTIEIFTIIIGVVPCKRYHHCITFKIITSMFFYMYNLTFNFSWTCSSKCMHHKSSCLFLSVQEWYVNYFNILDNLKCSHHAFL